MAKVIVGTQGRINELISGIKDEDIIDFHVNNDKAWVIISGKSAPIGAPIIEEKIVEVEKIVEIDNPEHLETIKALKAQIASFAAENAALNKDLDACKKENLSLKQQNGKLRKAIEAIE